MALFVLCLSFQPLHAADPLTETFQKGLFEEEANRDLTAAVKAYEEVVRQLDGQRHLAATAVFRLGECYRKLGRTNDAVAQFQRITREYSDDETLVKLSRQNLLGLGIQGSPTPQLNGDETSDLARETASLSARLEQLKSARPEEVGPVLETLFKDRKYYPPNDNGPFALGYLAEKYRELQPKMERGGAQQQPGDDPKAAEQKLTLAKEYTAVLTAYQHSLANFISHNERRLKIMRETAARYGRETQESKGVATSDLAGR